MNLIVGIGHIDHHRIAVFVELTLNRQRAEVLHIVVGNLLTVHRQALREVATTIEETDGAHIDVRVGSLFHIVTGQHTQTARIDLQGGVDTILHTEVCHRRTFGVRLHVHILAEQSINFLDALHQRLVFQNLFLAFKTKTLKQHHGVMLHIVIQLRVEVME